MDKGQISRTVRELEELGLVSALPIPTDGRSSLLSATPQGLERLAAARDPQRALARSTTLDDWSIDEIEQPHATAARALAPATRPESAASSSRRCRLLGTRISGLVAPA